jgi:Ca2+-binding EF-hand superfamily protein
LSTASLFVASYYLLSTQKKPAQEPVTETSEQVRKWLAIFDKDNDGMIESSELVTLFPTLGERFSQKEAAAMVKALDTNGSGKINIDSAVKTLLAKA